MVIKSMLEMDECAEKMFGVMYDELDDDQKSDVMDYVYGGD